MSVRTVFDTVLDGTGAPIALAPVTLYRRAGSFTAAASLPPSTVEVMTNESGYWAANLTPNTEAVIPNTWLAVYPNGDGFEFVLFPGDPISVPELRLAGMVMTWSPADLQTAMEAYRASWDAALQAIDSAPGKARLLIDAPAGAISITLRSAPALSYQSGSLYAIIDDGTPECEIRRITSIAGNVVSFTSPLRFGHSANDPVQLTSDMNGIHVGLFGAKPSNLAADATPNTLGINRALETASALAAVSGQTLYHVILGPGKYWVNDQLWCDNNTFIEGQGPKQTALVVADEFAFPSTDVAVIHQKRAGIPVESQEGGVSERLYLRNFSIDGRDKVTVVLSTTTTAIVPPVSSTRTFVSVAAPEGTTAISVVSMTSFAAGDQICIQLDPKLPVTTYLPPGFTPSGTYTTYPLYHYTTVNGTPAGNVITITDPIPAGRSALVGAGFHHMQTMPVVSTTGFVAGDMIRFVGNGNEFHTVVKVISSTLLLIGGRPVLDVANGATVAKVNNGANGILASVQQPAFWENVMVENCKGEYGVLIADTQQVVFTNICSYNNARGLWMRSASLCYFRGLNLEDNVYNQVLMDDLNGYVNGIDTDPGTATGGTGCKWNSFIDVHIEGQKRHAQAGFDVVAGYDNTWINTMWGDSTADTSLWRFHSQIGPNPTNTVEQSYLLMGCSFPTSASGDATAIDDLVRRVRTRNIEDHQGRITTFGANIQTGGRSYHAAHYPGRNGRYLKVGAPLRTGNENNPLIEMFADANANTLQPHIMGYDNLGALSFRVDPDGTMQLRSFKGIGGVPAVALGPAAGTSPTGISNFGTDLGGRILFTLGTSPVPNAVLFTLTFTQTFATLPIPADLATSLNGAVARVGGTEFYVSNLTTSLIEWSVRGTALSAGQYTLYYHMTAQ